MQFYRICGMLLAVLVVSLSCHGVLEEGGARKHVLPTSPSAVHAVAISRADAIPSALSDMPLGALLASLEAEDMRIGSADVDRVMGEVWQKYVGEMTNRPDRQAEQANKAITYNGDTMRYVTTVVGKKPAAGYPLYLALHGGGGAPARVNDAQWEHMQTYYLGGVTNGMYLVPRGVNNAWNLHWHTSSFVCYDRIIENMIAFGQIDPNRVYLLGFSAGGDALYQIPARMADRWAAAAMSAGHPNGIAPDNYANLGFLIQVGARDAAYKRNQVAAEYGMKLNQLRAAHPDLYANATYLHAGRGHNFLDHGSASSRQEVFSDPAVWLTQGGEAPTVAVDAHSIRWLDQYVRQPLPRKIIWDVKARAERAGSQQSEFWPTPEKANLHYWIGVDRYDKDWPLEAERIVVEYDPSQRLITVHEIGNFVRFYLHPAMVRPEKGVTVQVAGQRLTTTPQYSLRTLVQSVLDRGDPNYMFPARLTLSRNATGVWVLE